MHDDSSSTLRTVWQLSARGGHIPRTARSGPSTPTRAAGSRADPASARALPHTAHPRTHPSLSVPSSTHSVHHTWGRAYMFRGMVNAPSPPSAGMELQLPMLAEDTAIRGAGCTPLPVRYALHIQCVILQGGVRYTKHPHCVRVYTTLRGITEGIFRAHQYALRHRVGTGLHRTPCEPHAGTM
jgi:hypothetical protein